MAGLGSCNGAGVRRGRSDRRRFGGGGTPPGTGARGARGRHPPEGYQLSLSFKLSALIRQWRLQRWRSWATNPRTPFRFVR